VISVWRVPADGKTPQTHLAVLTALFSPDQSLVTSHQSLMHPACQESQTPREKKLQSGGVIPRLPLGLLLWQHYISNRDDHHGRSRELSALSSTPA
jgi:hypothetical protein